jgi:hypothetical protein
MRQSVFRIIDDGGQLVPRDQENITGFEDPGPLGLHDLRFPRNEPDQHMLLECYFGFEEFIVVATQLDIRCYVLGLVFHMHFDCFPEQN